MKSIGVWNYYESLNKENYLLLNSSTGIGDDLLKPFNKLYLDGKKNNINFMTLDMIDNFNNMDGFIFFDFPDLNNEYVEKVFKTGFPKYLIIFESELIRPDNWNIVNHQLFEKIFTWNDNFVDNTKYFKLNFSQQIPKIINKDLSKKERLCTLIAGNKQNNHSLELYSKRVEAIRWFENNHPDDFDLYGIGWDKYSSSNRYIDFIIRKLKLSKILATKYKSYKGKVDNKKITLEKYKFAICYENARDVSGYITEKIFDCLFAGCIPIYWGADNIADYIPKNCFVDKRMFDSYETMYQYINNMSDDMYLEYLDNIEKYLNSDGIYQFSSGYFAKKIVKEILNER